MFLKICGITNVADGRTAASAGVQAIGLNFYSQSPRFVQPATAHEIIQSIPPFIEVVGLFANAPITEILHVVNLLGIRTVQLHGEIDPQVVSQLHGLSVVPAFPLRDESDVTGILHFIDQCRQLGRLPSAILVDAHVEGKFGGTGEKAPWAIARSVVQQSSLPVMLAGGLTSKNVAQAIRTVRPWGVDVASGVEVAPGRKEAYKIRSFVDAVRRA